MPTNKVISLFLFMLSASAVCYGIDADSLKLHTDFAYLKTNNKLFQDFYYQSPLEFTGNLSVSCYKFTSASDSILIYRKNNKSVDIKKGTGTTALNLSEKDDHTFLLYNFYKVVKDLSVIPPGNYKIYFSLEGEQVSVSDYVVRHIDSALSATSDIRRSIDQTLVSEKSGLKDKVPDLKAGKAFSRYKRKLQRELQSKRLTPVQRSINGKEYIDLYYESWFVGRYEARSDQSISSQIDQKRNALQNNLSSQASNSLESYRSIFSQLRELNKGRKDNDEVSGQFGISTYLSTGQEEYSQQENNYYELNGIIEAPILGMPVTIEGFYTSQDQSRTIDASYVRVKYDIEKEKSKLLDMISGYREKYAQTDAKGKGLEQVYGAYLDRLRQQKGKLVRELLKETGVKDLNTGELNEETLKNAITGEAKKQSQDSLVADSEAGRTSDSLQKVYEKAMAKYNSMKEMEENIRKYEGLLNQYQETRFFDSLMAYDKLKDLESVDQMSYKELAQKASSLLPEEKRNSFKTGITNLELGMFPKYVSGYTVSGQTIKGLDFGYDFGLFEAAVTVGKSEYIARDGQIDRYTAYSGRIVTEPIKKQKLSFIYYGYTPSRRMLKENDFFKNIDVALPSFTEPMHIYSVQYNGTVTKGIIAEAEVALSDRRINTQYDNKLTVSDRLAYRANVEGLIPKTPLSMVVNYERAGKHFENNSMPISPAGTERYTIGTKGTFLKSFLTLGVEYNFMKQENFVTTGGNKRWGFEVGTHSKRYPSLYVSYKPFSTFRSHDDTLTIAQRPVFGSVWTSRVSYQIKRPTRSYRFQLMYNRNSSIIDTLQYGNELLQFTGIYSTGRLMAMLNLRMNNISSSNMETIAAPHMHTKFAGINASYMLTKLVNITIGQEVGLAALGISRYSALGAGMYSFEKIPLAIRLGLRYTGYKLEESAVMKKIIGGNLDLTWRFRFKTKE